MLLLCSCSLPSTVTINACFNLEEISCFPAASLLPRSGSQCNACLVEGVNRQGGSSWWNPSGEAAQFVECYKDGQQFTKFKGWCLWREEYPSFAVPVKHNDCWLLSWEAWAWNSHLKKGATSSQLRVEPFAPLHFLTDIFPVCSWKSLVQRHVQYPLETHYPNTLERGFWFLS